MVDLLNVNALPEDGEWPATIPQLESGWYPTGGEVDPANDGGLLNWPNRELATRTRILRERVDTLMVNAGSLTTVGPGGDFATINAALSKLSEHRPVYVPGGFKSEIRLLNGYMMAEQVMVFGNNLGWLTITSEAAEVIISRGALSQVMVTSFPAFGATNGGVLPSIETLFVMDETGVAADRVGIYLNAAASGIVLPGGGIKNAGAHGARIENGSRIGANGSNFAGAKENCIYAAGVSAVSLSQANLSNAGGAGILATNNAVVHADQANITGCNTYGVRAHRNGSVNIFGSNARRNGPTGADTPADISTDSGGIICAVTALGGLSAPANTATGAGTIYR